MHYKTLDGVSHSLQLQSPLTFVVGQYATDIRLWVDPSGRLYVGCWYDAIPDNTIPCRTYEEALAQGPL